MKQNILLILSAIVLLILCIPNLLFKSPIKGKNDKILLIHGIVFLFLLVLIYHFLIIIDVVNENFDNCDSTNLTLNNKTNNEIFNLDMTTLNNLDLNCLNEKLLYININNLETKNYNKISNNNMTNLDISKLNDINNLNYFSVIQCANFTQIQINNLTDTQLSNINLDTFKKLQGVWIYFTNKQLFALKNIIPNIDQSCIGNDNCTTIFYIDTTKSNPVLNIDNNNCVPNFISCNTNCNNNLCKECSFNQPMYQTSSFFTSNQLQYLIDNSIIDINNINILNSILSYTPPPNMNFLVITTQQYNKINPISIPKISLSNISRLDKNFFTSLKIMNLNKNQISCLNECQIKSIPSKNINSIPNISFLNAQYLTVNQIKNLSIDKIKNISTISLSKFCLNMIYALNKNQIDALNCKQLYALYNGYGNKNQNIISSSKYSNKIITYIATNLSKCYN